MIVNQNDCCFMFVTILLNFQLLNNQNIPSMLLLVFQVKKVLIAAAADNILVFWGVFFCNFKENKT